MAREKKQQRDSGEPGGGAGRRDEDVGGSGVYPASGEHPRAAELRTPGEWGQKLGGQVGGSSELNPYDLGLTDRELEQAAQEPEPGAEEEAEEKEK